MNRCIPRRESLFRFSPTLLCPWGMRHRFLLLAWHGNSCLSFYLSRQTRLSSLFCHHIHVAYPPVVWKRMMPHRGILRFWKSCYLCGHDSVNMQARCVHLQCPPRDNFLQFHSCDSDPSDTWILILQSILFLQAALQEAAGFRLFYARAAATASINRVFGWDCCCRQQQHEQPSSLHVNAWAWNFD